MLMLLSSIKSDGADYLKVLNNIYTYSVMPAKANAVRNTQYAVRTTRYSTQSQSPHLAPSNH